MNQSPESVRQACADLKEINILEDTSEFHGFMGKLKNIADRLADKVLHDDALTPEVREALRNERKGVLSVLQLPGEIKRGSMNLLASAGIKLEDQLPEDP